jgi:hypothetical protein
LRTGPASQNPSAKFDVHLASDILSPELRYQLLQLGFTKDEFIGGTTGVVHPCHYSSHPTSRDACTALWARTVKRLSQAPPASFYGYAEAEVTPPQYRSHLEWKPFDPGVPFPFGRFEHEAAAPGQHKDFDIHVSVDLSRLDPRLQRLLEEEVGFYYVDIRKQPGKVVRVYTVQPCGIKRFPEFYMPLLAYFLQAGGCQGKIKLEATYAFARFPETARVPPIITRIPPASCTHVP